jgi:hypothetical protein
MMTQSYRGYCLKYDYASQLPSTVKGEILMSNKYWLTPEEMLLRKKRNKFFLYGSIVIGAIILSAIVTLLANNIS